MATQNVVVVGNLGTEFDIGTVTANAITIKINGTIVKDATTGELGVDITALDIVSADAGNLLTVGADGGAVFNQAALQAAETVWAGTSSADGFMTVTPAGTNGHAPTFSFDYSNADFCEGIQDCVGQAILAGAGVTYDDVANSISSALGSLTFGDGLTTTGTTSVAVLPDPASPNTVSVSAAGVSVTSVASTDTDNILTIGTDGRPLVTEAAVTDLATIDLCDAFGVDLGTIFP